MPAPRQAPTPAARRAMGRATVALPHVTQAAGDSVTPGAEPLDSGRSTADMNTGSLTGEVLAHGDPDQSGRSRKMAVLFTILGALSMLAAFGVIVGMLAGDAVSSFFEALVG